MPEFIEITSKDNPLIKFVSGLQASSKHRKEAGLFVYGVADITTQTVMNNIALESEILVDSQFDKAYEYVKENIK